jgi:hypothetical protein
MALGDRRRDDLVEEFGFALQVVARLPEDEAEP